MRSNRLPRQRRPGLRVIGPGFYVWDADSREALRLARDLDRHREPPPVQQRGPLPRPQTP
jgi:hypothetical protein